MRRSLRPTLLFAAAVVIVACKAKVTGPTPSISGFTPTLVCNQRTTEVKISGAGLSPMVLDAATGNQKLALPDVTLERVKDPQGGAVSTAPVVMAGNEANTHVRWTSQNEMAFDVYPELALLPGVYKITVTNPDGHSVSVESALDVVPPPTLTALSPVTVCRNVQPGVVRAFSDNFLQVGTSGAADTKPVLTIGGHDFAADAMNNCHSLPGPTLGASCMGFDALVDGSLFALGQYDATVTNPSPAACSSDILPLVIKAVDGPTVLFVDPPILWNGQNTPVTVYAAGVTPAVANVSILMTGSAGTPTSLSFTPETAHPDRPDAIVPAGTAAGNYDLFFTDANNCPAVLSSALTVVATTSLRLSSISPDFGYTGTSTSVSLKAIIGGASAGFVPLPVGYLTRAGLASPVPLGSIAISNPTTLTATVPSGLAVGTYDVVIVNGDKTVGVLRGAFHVAATPPPKVSFITPGQVPVGSATEMITLTGVNFPAMSPTVVLRCINPSGVAITPDQTATVTSFSSTSITANIATNVSYPVGATCVVDVIDNQTLERDSFSSLVVITPQANLTGFDDTSPSLNTAREGHGAVAGDASRSARFVYAVAGDDGTNALKSVESLSVDIFGRPGAAFVPQRYSLTTTRTHVGVVRAGRFLYAVGGASVRNDATTALNTVERAVILDPDFTPQDLGVGVAVSTTAGLPGGIYYYRVAAIMAGTDAFNPGGETLPSRAFGLRLPTLSGGRQVTVDLSWTTVTGAVGYRLYRSVANGAGGSETLIADTTGTLPGTVVCSSAIQCTDLGATPDGANRPLPIGSTGKWSAIAQTMGMKRQGAGVTFALDPMNAAKGYLYVFGGLDATGTPLDSYEFLTIVLNGNGSHDTTGGWTAGGANVLTGARWKVGGFSLSNRDTTKVLVNKGFVWAGPGIDNAATPAQVGNLDGAEITAGTGVLSTFTAVDTNTQHAGYGAFGFGDILFIIGGAGNAPAVDNKTLTIGAPPAIFATQGFSPGLKTGRVDTAAAVQSGFFYVIGGRTAAGVTKTTEYILY